MRGGERASEWGLVRLCSMQTQWSLLLSCVQMSAPLTRPLSLSLSLQPTRQTTELEPMICNTIIVCAVKVKQTLISSQHYGLIQSKLMRQTVKVSGETKIGCL